MRVHFAPCGVGLGHAGRCIPIARGLQQRNDKTEVFFSTYRDAVSYVRQEGFPTIEVPAMDFQVEPDGTVDFRRTALNPGPFVAPFNFLRQVGAEMAIIGTFEPDVVVSDSRASPIVAARMLGIPTICILNQFQVVIPRRTHYLRLAKLADAITLALIGKIWTSGAQVMIPDFPPPYTISADNLRIPKAYKKKIRLIGPILSVRPQELSTKKKLRKKLGLHDEKTLIFAPISGPLKERTYINNVLQRIFTRFPDDFQIVMSLGHPKLRREPLNYGDFTVAKWIPNRFEYLKACDIVVSRAGHGTMMQTICYGKPTILIPTPNHTEQHNNAKKGLKLGVALIIEQTALNEERLLSATKEIVEHNGLTERAEELKEEVSVMDGLETAIQTTLEVAEGGETLVSA